MTASLPTHLYGYATREKTLRLLAEQLNAKWCGLLEEGADSLPAINGHDETKHRIAVMGNPTSECLRHLMTSGFSGCCEADCDIETLTDIETLSALCEALPTPPARGFFLLLSTQTAYRTDLATLLIDIAKTHHDATCHGDNRQTWSMIETALQEVIANALIHGNLGIESHTRGDLEGFKTFSQMITLKLDDPAYARKPISIRAWLEPGDIFGVEIQDQGQGYTPPGSEAEIEYHDDKAAYGRGLKIIHSCAESVTCFNEGRGIRVTFLLNDDAPEQNAFDSRSDSLIFTNSIRKPPERDLTLATLETLILVVDDDFVSRELITSYLSLVGFRNIETAQNGREALEKIKNNKPGLLILDIVMPELDGLEICRRLRADKEYQSLPILVQTAHDKPDDRRRIFAAGATDLVFKPIHGEELAARVRIHIENMLLLSDMRQYQERVANELAFARKMQFDMLPDETNIAEIHTRYSVRLDTHFAPSSELGGDFWGVFGINKNMLGVYMVDFTGHGVMSALNTVRLHTMVREIPLTLADPVAFIEEINLRLSQLLPVGQFATIVYGTLDIEKHNFTYAAAAAPNPIAGSTISSIQAYDGGGMPLGISKTIKYSKRTIPAPPGSFILLYSDALIEAVDSKGTLFGEEKLLQLVSQSYDPKRNAPCLQTLLTQFETKVVTPIEDDLTVICLIRDDQKTASS